MKTAQDTFKEFISGEVHPLLKSVGFKKKQFSFHRWADGIWHVIQFQKSASSSSSRIEFTINVSVFSELLNEHAKGTWRYKPTEARPTEPACHVRERIGVLMSAGDTWWSVTPETSCASLGTTITSALRDFALPFLAAHATDEMIRDAWIRSWQEGGRGGGLSLARLLCSLGPDELFEPYLGFLEAKAHPQHATALSASIEQLRRRKKAAKKKAAKKKATKKKATKKKATKKKATKKKATKKKAAKKKAAGGRGAS